MTMKKRNIQFSYLYRDASNYKQWGHITFTNPQGLDACDLDRRLRFVMIDSTFMADQVRIPNLFLFDTLPVNQDDHCLHEFDSIVIVDEQPNDRHERSILEFVQEVERVALQGWEGFVPGLDILFPTKRFKFLI
jgi:hypothetical protein